MRINKLLAGLFATFAMLLPTGCSDDTVPEAPQGSVQLEETSVVLPQKGRYYSIAVTSNAAPGTLSVTTDADWISISTPTVTDDGYAEFCAEPNYGDAGRDAVIIISAPDGHAAECRVHQNSASDDDDNALAENFFYVGYGYNIFDSYQNTNSIYNPVIDIHKLAAVSNGRGIQTQLRGGTDVETITATSLYEMAELLTKKMEKTESGLTGSKKTVVRFDEGSIGINETGYAYINLKNTVASSAIDFSYIQYVMDKDNGQSVDLFTADFRKMYDKVVKSPTEANIKDIFKKYGTHIITFAELGSMMDVTVNFSREMSGALKMRAEDFADYFFNHEPSEFVDGNGKVQGMTTKLKSDNTFTISGGGEKEREQIVNDCVKLGKIRQETLQAWLNSVPENPLTGDVDPRTLAPHNFQLVPIWSLFPTEVVDKFLKCAKKESEKLTNSIAPYLTGIDYYAINIDRQPFMTFDAKDETLVRVLYAGNGRVLQPVLEICNEYVPVLRGDKRVTVVYPIREGRVFHGSGLFPGDGEGNPPAFLTFSGGKVYVMPVKGADANDKLENVYYMHGNLYADDLGLNLTAPSRTNVEAQWLTVNHDDVGAVNYPIVKIGSGYWTRQNMRGTMMFGEPIDPSDKYSDYYTYEEVRSGDNMLFANFFDGNQYDFLENNNTYGTADGQWYIPAISDAADLSEYLGQNLKALLCNQASGFDAQFAGAYLRYDIMSGNKDLGYYRYVHDGQYCFIPFKNNSTEGAVLVLDKGYNLKTMKVDNTREGFYPMRLFRTADYKYSDK